MPRPEKEIYDSIRGRTITNPPEWYDYNDNRYFCTSRDAFSGKLSITKRFPSVAMADDFNKIIKWARENKILSESGSVTSFMKKMFRKGKSDYS